MATVHTIGHVTQFGKISESEQEIYGDLIVSGDSSGNTRRVRFTPEQEAALQELENHANFKFKSWSDATRQMWSTLYEHITDKKFPPNRENAPTAENVKIILKIEES